MAKRRMKKVFWKNSSKGKGFRKKKTKHLSDWMGGGKGKLGFRGENVKGRTEGKSMRRRRGKRSIERRRRGDKGIHAGRKIPG